MMTLCDEVCDVVCLGLIDGGFMIMVLAGSGNGGVWDVEPRSNHTQHVHRRSFEIMDTATICIIY